MLLNYKVNRGDFVDKEDYIVFDPEIPRKYRNDFNSMIDDLLVYSNSLDREVTVKDEINRINKEEVSEGEIRYLAVLEVLLDLIEIGYDLRKNSEVKVIPPQKDTDSDEEYKELERQVLQKERRVQFEDESVRRFIQQMESGGKSRQGKGIRSLIMDGKDLYEEFSDLKTKEEPEILDELEDKVDPYIQVVEKGERDSETGLKLRDIWRYFRYTWLTPYNQVPGRNIEFLIRDAAQKDDPVMGIASLGSPIMNIGVRDKHIGWTIDAIEERLERKKKHLEYKEELAKEERTEDKKKRTVKKTKYLETEEEYEERVQREAKKIRETLTEALEEALEQIRYEDFIQEFDELDEEDFELPKDRTFEILEKIKKEAQEKIEDPEFEDENPDKLDSWEHKSETPLFRKKRSDTLHELLKKKEYFASNSDKSDLEFMEDALNHERGRKAIKRALRELKKRKVGANMMNIMVCGAIPPYNEILGGKLVGMSLTGPKVIETYKDKYSDQESKIAGAMAGEPVVKSNELVFLDTTSLFGTGSAQYSRIRVPAPNGEIEYENIGKTKGYGSIQFGPETRERLSQVTEFSEGRKVVRGRFGEGVAPRMRKIKKGLKNCGLKEELMRHESSRIVFGIDLADNAREFLRNEDKSPEYYWDFEDIEKEQQSIYDYWRERWVKKRIQKEEILKRLKEFDPKEFMLSNEAEFDQKQLSDFIVEGK